MLINKTMFWHNCLLPRQILMIIMVPIKRQNFQYFFYKNMNKKRSLNWTLYQYQMNETMYNDNDWRGFCLSIKIKLMNIKGRFELLVALSCIPIILQKMKLYFVSYLYVQVNFITSTFHY